MASVKTMHYVSWRSWRTGSASLWD